MQVMQQKALEDLLSLYRIFASDIDRRIEEFLLLWREASEHRLFMEAVFCLFTPQSKAKNCWRAVLDLEERGLLYRGSPREVASCIRGLVRFHNTKARRLEGLRALFAPNGVPKVRERVLEMGRNPKKCRDALSRQVSGYGLKEASHFLRNVGYSLDLAIVDRHILKNLADMGIIKVIPKVISRKVYMNVEEKFAGLADALGLSVAQLDLLLWAKQTGYVFK